MNGMPAVPRYGQIPTYLTYPALYGSLGNNYAQDIPRLDRIAGSPRVLLNWRNICGVLMLSRNK